MKLSILKLSIKKLPIVLILCLFASVSLAASEQLVLAHRGASGYLPEHSFVAKAVAHTQGADYLEQDVVLTRDGVPIVLHDVHLDTLTDVAKRFPQRKREDGRYYAIDFTLAEIKQLKTSQRFNAGTGEPVYPARFPLEAYTYQLHTLEEEIHFIQGLNHSTGREVGLFPEIKQTTFHEREGQDIVRIVFDLLQRYGYGKDKDSKAMIHSFEPSTLRRLRLELGWQARLELAYGEGNAVDGSSYEHLATPAGLKELATYADSVWTPAKRMFAWDESGELHITDFARDAHAAGLQVFGGVIVREALPENCPSLDAWHDAVFNGVGADGVVTDFPDVSVQWLKQYKNPELL